MNPPTEAQLETADRQCIENRKRLQKAIPAFGHAKGELTQQWNHLKATNKAKSEETRAKRFAEAENCGEKAAVHFFTALGYLRNPDLPGVEAEELARREQSSRSVMAAPGPHLIGHLDGEGREQQRENSALAARRNGSMESIFGELTRRVSVSEILERMPDAGWNNDAIAKLCANMLTMAQESKSLVKMQTAMKTVLEMLRIVEPKAVVTTDRNIEDMTEDETKELMQTLGDELGLQ
jgi:hypothetical protein